jgi:hypothetical protein
MFEPFSNFSRLMETGLSLASANLYVKSYVIIDKFPFIFSLL